jgi:hypothetical protein
MQVAERAAQIDLLAATDDDFRAAFAAAAAASQSAVVKTIGRRSASMKNREDHSRLH